MSALIHGLRQLKLAVLRRQDLLRLQGIGRLDGVTPLFERKPHWSTRFTYPLVIAQLTISVVGAELIINHWTQKVDAPADAQPSSSKPEPEYVLRPIWQRVPLALGQALVGAYVCTVLLNTRARIIRRVYVLPGTSVTRSAPFAPRLERAHAVPRAEGPKGGAGAAAPGVDRVVVLQNVWHWRGQGNVFPFSACRLERARDDAEASLAVEGVPGKFFLPLAGGKVNGEEKTVEWVRHALFNAWYGPKRAKKELGKHAWEPARISS